MSNCIKCGSKLDTEGILCDKCRGEMMGFSSTPTAASSETGKEEILEAPLPVSKTQKQQLTPSSARGGAPPSGAAEEKSIKKVKKKKAPEGPKKSTEEVQKEEYTKLMVEYEQSKKSHEADERKKQGTPQGGQDGQYPQQPYYDPYTQQYYQYPPEQGQYPQPYPDPYQQQQQYPSAAQQEQLDPSNSKVCKRCGTLNERWRLSCSSCKSTLG